MVTPKKLDIPSITNPRLVTKTSLTNPKQVVALFLLLWFGYEKPASTSYGTGEWLVDNGRVVDVDKGVINEVTSCVTKYAQEHQIDVSNVDFSDILASNPLFTAQIEALNAGFELIWHLGRFVFDGSSRNLSAERTGGKRYPKTIHFTCNLDLISLVAEPDEDGFAAVVFSWLTGKSQQGNQEIENRLLRMLAAFAETSYYKTSKGATGHIYAPSGVYDAALEGNEEVNLVEENAEAQGPTRIFKTILKDGLNPYLTNSHSEVIRNTCVNEHALREYSERAKTAISLSRIELSEKDFGNVNVVSTRVNNTDEPRNLIYFGAPGTGKSFKLQELAKENFAKDSIRRVTFYPDYTYSQFVGSYRPNTKDGDISYSYIPGPFLETYMDASLHPYENYLLIIEEINRANPAAVFGDVFQLLDRDDSGASEYYVSVPIEMSDCINDELNNASKDASVVKGIESFFDPDMDFQGYCHSMLQHLSLPSNMFIWATMNSADQGVFPMDTAFKRRWDFCYIDIDAGENAEVSDIYVTIAGKSVNWNKLRKALNKLLFEEGINEDKLLGPFFVKPQALLNEDTFSNAFKNKVLLYLYEDAAKMYHSRIFAKEKVTYSQLCKDFDCNGLKIFKLGNSIMSELYGSDATTTDVPAEE